ncbi:MAG: CHASE domain-containing protein [Candidatus Dojkabacteria bacterium]
MFTKFKEKFLVPLLGFIVIMTLVIILCIYFASNLIVQSRQNFDVKANDIEEKVDSNFSEYVNFLKDVQGLFASSSNVERSEFSTFIKNVDFVSRYPGITTVAFSKKVTREDKQSFLDELNNDTTINPNGGAKYSIANDTDKDVYYLLKFAEPFTDTTAFGFDSTSTEARKINILRAVDTNETVMTEKLPLSGANAGQFGFSIYLPVYKEGSINDTVEQRQANNVGVILGSFRVNNVFSKIFNDPNLFQGLSLKIYTDGTEDDSLKLFDSNVDMTSTNLLDTTLDLTIASRQWNFKFTAANGYGLSTTERAVPVGTFIIGFFLALLGSIYLYRSRISQNNALILADQIKIKLAESEAQLKNVLEGIDLIVFAIDPKGTFTLSVGKGLTDLGLKQNELVGLSIFDNFKDNPEYTETIKKALSGEQIMGTAKVGEIIYETRFTPILDKNEKLVSVVGVSQNVTDRDESERKIKAKTDELERLNKIMINRELKMVELKKQLNKE